MKQNNPAGTQPYFVGDNNIRYVRTVTFTNRQLQQLIKTIKKPNYLARATINYTNLLN